MAGIELTVINLAIGVFATILAIIGILIQRPPDKLELDLIDGAFEDVDRIDNQDSPSRFFHVAVRNNHKRRIARNCYAFLISLKNDATGEEYIKQSSELKWRGYNEPFASILPQTYRKFDGFWVMKKQPDFLMLSAFLDSTRLIPRIKGQISLIAEYLVVSENFKTTKGTFVIKLDKDLDKISISKNINFGRASDNT
ncbi:hypothetical protein Thermo_00075 [Thermoplasmatales archaeon]|nr:hypothetical protein Thermo_00075 [Thermoplasmatales archaeon]